jgi:hypothetical protein
LKNNFARAFVWRVRVFVWIRLGKVFDRTDGRAEKKGVVEMRTAEGVKREGEIILAACVGVWRRLAACDSGGFLRRIGEVKSGCISAVRGAKCEAPGIMSNILDVKICGRLSGKRHLLSPSVRQRETGGGRKNNRWQIRPNQKLKYL